MIGALVGYLRNGANELLGPDVTQPIRVVMMSLASNIGARIKLCVFCGTECFPRLVCQVARHSSGEASLEAEWSTRRQIYSRLPLDLRRSIPAPLAMPVILDAPVLIEQGMTGVAQSWRLRSRFGFRRRRAMGMLIEVVSRWVSAFQRSTACGVRAWTIEDEHESVREALVHTEQWLRKDRLDGFLELLEQQVAPLRGVAVRWAAQHGDLAPGNILWGPDGFAVVDWEWVQRTGPCFVDPLTFIWKAMNLKRASDDEWAGEVPAHTVGLRTMVREFLRETLGDLQRDPAVLYAAMIVSLLARCRQSRANEMPPALPLLVKVVRQPRMLEWIRV